MSEHITFWDHWQVKEELCNNDLCHVNQIRLIKVEKISRVTQSAEKVFDKLKKKVGSRICNVKTLEFVVSCPKSITCHLQKERVWFLGTKFVNTSSGFEIFLTLEHGLIVSFLYSDFDMRKEDYIAVF